MIRHLCPPTPKLAPCAACGDDRVVLDWDRDDGAGVVSVMAAHSCEGIGTIESWRLSGDGWQALEATTEGGREIDSFDLDGGMVMPLEPPLVADGGVK